MKKYIVLAILMSSAATLVQAQDDTGGACEKMKSFAMEGVVIDSAAPERSGTFASAVGTKLSNLPAFCRVVGHATPTPQSRIGFEVWLPEKNWSGRYVQVGNGGLAGIIFHDLMGQMLDRGHATASTDNGHTGSAIDGRWAIGQPEKVRDFAERAVHLLSDIGKRVTAKYYENAAQALVFFRMLGRRSRSADRGATISAGLRRHRCWRTRPLLDGSPDRLRARQPGVAQRSGELHSAGQAADDSAGCARGMRCRAMV